jgi:soluble lytic murein transglycosylase
MKIVPIQARGHSSPDKDAPHILSSMLKHVAAPLFLVASAAFASTLVPELPVRTPPPDDSATLKLPSAPAPASRPVAAPAFDPLRGAVYEWNRLRQSETWPFSDYARFLIAHPGWPLETALRRVAERRIDPLTTSASEIANFFSRFAPLTNIGRARHAEALSTLGRPTEARTAALAAWNGGPLPATDEARLLARFGTQFTALDHDRRMEQLLWDRATTAAQRQLHWTSAARRPLYEARLAMQLRWPDAADRAMAVGAGADRDPGFVADRARWLRDTGQSAAARAYIAAPRTFEAVPFDPADWLDTLLIFARAAAYDNQWTLAYDIAAKADTAYAPGTAVRDRNLGERDDYTSQTRLV